MNVPPAVKTALTWQDKTADLWGSPVVSGTRAYHSGSSGSCMLRGGAPMDQTCSSLSSLFIILQMLSQIGIWGIWRPGQHLGPLIVFLELFLIHMNASSHGLPAEHRIVMRWSMLFTSPANSFNVVAKRCKLVIINRGSKVIFWYCLCRRCLPHRKDALRLSGLGLHNVTTPSACLSVFTFSLFKWNTLTHWINHTHWLAPPLRKGDWKA